MNPSSPRIRASASQSLDIGFCTELDAVSAFSEIVPDTVIFDDFERYFPFQATKAYNYIHKNGYRSKLMAAAVRNKQDLFNLLGIDYIITPLKVLQSLKESVSAPGEKFSLVRRLSPESAAMYNFSKEELIKWDQQSLASAMGPAAVELLAAGLDGHAEQAKRLEELFGKIWPPPNV